MALNLKELQYPAGTFSKPTSASDDQIKQWIYTIEHFPAKVLLAIERIGEKELNWKYRPDGWKLKQVVHHCADSHLNCLLRLKLTLTEDAPIIKPYLQAKWAELSDSQDDDISSSIQILIGVHAKLAQLMTQLTAEDLDRYYIHPEYNSQFTLLQVIALYAWHCDHHLAHIHIALDSEGKHN